MKYLYKYKTQYYYQKGGSICGIVATKNILRTFDIEKFSNTFLKSILLSEKSGRTNLYYILNFLRFLNIKYYKVNYIDNENLFLIRGEYKKRGHFMLLYKGIYYNRMGFTLRNFTDIYKITLNSG